MFEEDYFDYTYSKEDVFNLLEELTLEHVVRERDLVIELYDHFGCDEHEALAYIREWSDLARNDELVRF